MGLLADLVLQTANAPGTATFNLIAPSAGRRSFISATGAGQTYYYAHDGTNWEIGYGTVTAGSPDTLSRDTVLANSLGTTARINFVIAVNLWNDVPAARSIYAAADNVTVPFGGRVQTGLGAGVSSSDSPQLGQVGWVRIGADVIPTAGTAAVAFTLDTTKYAKFRFEWADGVPAAAAIPYVQVSINGSTYRTGATDYAYGYISQSGTAVTGGVANLDYLPLGPAGGTTAAHGYIEIDWGISFFDVRTKCYRSGFINYEASGSYPSTTAITSILFGFVGSTISVLRARLLGWGF